VSYPPRAGSAQQARRGAASDKNSAAHHTSVTNCKRVCERPTNCNRLREPLLQGAASSSVRRTPKPDQLQTIARAHLQFNALGQNLCDLGDTTAVTAILISNSRTEARFGREISAQSTTQAADFAARSWPASSSLGSQRATRGLYRRNTHSRRRPSAVRGAVLYLSLAVSHSSCVRSWLVARKTLPDPNRALRPLRSGYPSALP
jgi:hypothetical protein